MIDASSLARLDALAQADLCHRGEVSAEELFDAALARIDALDPLLRSVVAVRRDRPRSIPEGPFRGVPFLVKDATPWPDLRWSMGSRLFRANVIQASTPYARALVQAGLVCVGKSSTSEFGLLASTETLLDGVTHNPWDLSCSPAGSSGGSAVAVAAGLVAIAHANDGGGSIRMPASACGVFGFKPSRGRHLSASFARSDFLDITSEHCITRSVRDSAAWLSVTEDTSGGAPVGFVQHPIDRALRVAAWTPTMTGGDAEPAVRRAYDDTLALLASLGHAVEEIPAPRFDPTLRDAFFLVAGGAVAGVVDMLDRTRSTPVQEHELEPFTWALVDAFRARGPDALAWSRAAFAEASRVYLAATRAYDVVLTPTLATAPWPVGHLSPVLPHEELLARTARSVGYTPIQNVAGCPAMSVPLWFPRAPGDGVLPIGMHFAAAPGQDAMLLRLAYQLEEACPWKDRWPTYAYPRLFA